MPSTNTHNENENENENEYYDQDIEKQKVLRQRRFYPTRIGGYCINAVTGAPYYDIKQGSYEELRLYRVLNCTGIYDKKGFLRRKNDPINYEPNILYYDNPEQYERHVKKKLPQSQINTWHTNVRCMFPDGGKFVKAEWEKSRKNNYNIILRSSQELSEDEWK
ncbi:MAG: hypothetical protein CMI79_05375 [Candidatus Pelagibacter sp.]|nr:hypothetical protein [Candidatus Pelagibacter sp.]|tara:strand:- start:894 stop:1382 length:489 start_codon:yes stop_codon:yes gene_type:complete